MQICSNSVHAVLQCIKTLKASLGEEARPIRRARDQAMASGAAGVLVGRHARSAGRNELALHVDVQGVPVRRPRPLWPS